MQKEWNKAHSVLVGLLVHGSELVEAIAYEQLKVGEWPVMKSLRCVDSLLYLTLYRSPISSPSSHLLFSLLPLPSLGGPDVLTPSILPSLSRGNFLRRLLSGLPQSLPKCSQTSYIRSSHCNNTTQTQ